MTRHTRHTIPVTNTARVDDPCDMHVMPQYGREHGSTCECWCSPHIAPGTDNVHYYRGRVWVHREDN